MLRDTRYQGKTNVPRATERVARADLPPDLAAANVACLRQMLAQQNQLQVPVARPSKSGR
jgi:Flp pilus assembly protein TadD